jgi:hypothetical protein
MTMIHSVSMITNNSIYLQIMLLTLIPFGEPLLSFPALLALRTLNPRAGKITS